MKIIILSKNKKLKNCFSAIEKSKIYNVEFLLPEKIKEVLKNPETGTFVYLDYSEYEKPGFRRHIGNLLKNKTLRVGIIDTKDEILDIAEYFFSGISDYINKELISTVITPKRIKQAANFIPVVLNPEEKKNHNEKYITSWDEIEIGKKYTFSFMFIEIDYYKEWKNRWGKHKFSQFVDNFRKFISSRVSEINGKIWMWTDLGGLIIFPYNGNPIKEITSCFKLMLNKHIISVEKFNSNILLSYHIVLHVGDTVYKLEGNTGTIISDSINSIFHLGQKFAKPGELYLTDRISSSIPTGLKEYFIPAGKFEGYNICRLKRLE